MIRQFLPTAIALAAGIALGGWIFGADDAALPPLADAAPVPGLAAAGGRARSTDARAAPEGDTAVAVARLARTLAGEQRKREVLEQRLEAMEQQLAAVQGSLEDVQRAADPGAFTEAAILKALEEDLEQASVDPDQQAIQRFIEAGFPPARARELKARQDRAALDRLFLRDQARREGWLGSARYREELARINGQLERLRDDLGEDDYDRYLYATGRPNRVLVRDTLTGGPADQAGLRPGDAIISYDGTRVFDTRSLTEQAQGGTFGAATPVEIERDGERMVLYIPRGPLGVNMRSAVRRPQG